MGFSYKFTSCQRNKKKDIEKKKKKKKNVEVSNVLGAIKAQAKMKQPKPDFLLMWLNSRIHLTMLFKRKIHLELLVLGGVVLLTHHPTHEKGNELHRSCMRLQGGDLMFNYLQAQYSLPCTRPRDWLQRFSISTGLPW
jgi:hypothetical protein